MKAKKILVSGLVALCLLGTLTFVASAYDDVKSPDTYSVVAPEAEETEWFHRIYYGVYQRRLWSYTRGIWLTDWIDC